MKNRISVTIDKPVEYQLSRLGLVALELDTLTTRLEVLREEAKHHAKYSVIRRSLEENITTIMFQITALRERLRYLQSLSESQE